MRTLKIHATRRFHIFAICSNFLAGALGGCSVTKEREGLVSMSERQVRSGPPILRMAAFTCGRDAPASRFRLRQYLPVLRAAGIETTEYWPRATAYPPAQFWLRPPWLAATLAERAGQVFAARGADVTFLQREMVSTLATLERFTPRPRLLDIDDAVHLFRGGRTSRRLGALADLVIAGNTELAGVWRDWAPRVEILPTAVDTASCPLSPLPERPVVGWIGSSANLRYLEALAEPLERVVRRFPQTVIAVCCDAPPVLPGLPVRFTRWRPDIEPAFVDSLGVGLMPLDNGPWERGKCSFKMLQYMAGARPCVVSPVGMNSDVLAQAPVGLAAFTPDQWAEAISALLADRDRAAGMGAEGRRLAERVYSIPVVAARLATLVRDIFSPARQR